MNGGLVRTVCVGMPKERAWAGIGRTSIEKLPVSGPVFARRLGLAGDQVSDTKNHGGVDQAVYAFSRAEIDWWERELSASIRDGQFGENLTIDAGPSYDVDDAEVGELWRIGTALLEVASVRIPCNDFKNWQRINGYDDTTWVKRFTAHGRTGAYLRVIEEGELRAGDTVTVEHRPGHGVTVATMFAAVTTDHSLLPRLLEVEGMVEEARLAAEHYVATH